MSFRSSSPDAKTQPKPDSHRTSGPVIYKRNELSTMGFEAIAEKLKDEKWKSCPDGEGDGVKVLTYFRRKSVHRRLKERCERAGISVSRYLATLAEMSLEDER